MPYDQSQSRGLTDIAAVLGVPVSDFFDASSSTLTRAAELMRLWEAISDDAGRDRLMALARELASVSAAGKGPDEFASR